MDGRLRAGHVEQVAQPTHVVDVPMRDHDPADILRSNGLAEVGSHGVKSGQDLPARFASPAAGIDQRGWPGLKHQVDAGRQILEDSAGDAVDPHPVIGDEPLDGW